MDAYSTNLPTAADDGPISLRCSNLIAWYSLLRQTAPVSFSRKETGAHTTAASNVFHGIAATPPRDNRPDKSDSSPFAMT